MNKTSMKTVKFGTYLVLLLMLVSCASGYKTINPDSIYYSSSDKKEGIELNYKYNLLDKKYAKKETKKGIRLVAVKITNNTENDIIFGDDFTLSYDNGNDLVFLDNESSFSSLKQSSASYLFYLLLTPINLYITKINSDSNGIQESTSTIPIGYVLGPGLAIGNLIGAGSANTKFKNELATNTIVGTTIKKGKTKSGLIGIKSTGFDAIRIKIKE